MSDSLRTYSAIKARICQVLAWNRHLGRSRHARSTLHRPSVGLRAELRPRAQDIAPFVQARNRMAWPLITDGSAARRYCPMLMVSIGYHRRALPITWKGQKGQTGRGGCPTGTADARQRGWNFVLWISGDSMLWIERGNSVRIKSHFPKQKACCRPACF